jgi:uncharacterized protein DUF4440
MCVSRRIVTGLIALLPVVSAHAQPQDSCEPQSLMQQQRDEATIQRLEALWNVAISQGDTSFERCLLTADFVEILSTGELKTRADELGYTAKNKGRKQRTPELPAITILIHGNVAVARAIWKPAGATRESEQVADCFVWENGVWRVVFSQLTPVEDSDRGRFLRGRLPL